MARLFLLTCLLAFTTVACGMPTRQLTVSQADLSDPNRTRMTNYLRIKHATVDKPESTRGAISRTVLQDEAYLSAANPDRTCVFVRIRTASDLDLPLSDWDIILNDRHVIANDEHVTVHDYPYSGERDIIVARAVSPSMAAQFRMTEQVTFAMRVYEREATICAPSAGRAPSEVVLDMTLRREGFEFDRGERFEWSIL